MTLESLTVTCLRCGHSWLRRTESPRMCPHCKSAYWDKPYKRPPKPTNQAAPAPEGG